MSKADPRRCYHRWEDYIGFIEQYKYCINCGVREMDVGNVWDEVFLKENFPHLFKDKEEVAGPEDMDEAAAERDIREDMYEDYLDLCFGPKPILSKQVWVEGQGWTIKIPD